MATETVDGLGVFSDSSNVDDCRIGAPTSSFPTSNCNDGSSSVEEEPPADNFAASAHDVADSSYDGPDTDLGGWFQRHALPVTDGVKNSLDDWGVLCVEQLKLIPSDVFLGMYESEKFVVKETAKIVLEKLKEEGPVDLSKCIVAQEVATTPTKIRNKKETIGALKPSPKKIPRNTKHMLEARQTEREDPDPVINDIVRLWSTTGHQNNLLRVNVCNALRAGYTKAKIGRAVRVRAFGAWDGVGKSDPIYKKIKSTLLRIHNDMRDGKFDDLNNVQNSEEYQKALASKSVKPGARGRKEGLKMQVRSLKPDDLEAPDLPALNTDEL